MFVLLKTNGLFVTQQVGQKNDSKLRLLLTGEEKRAGDENEEEWDLNYATKELESAGFEVIEKFETITYTRIYDIGALVYYLKAIPWEVPGFTVEKYRTKLKEIHSEILENGYLNLSKNLHRYYIKAKKT